MNPILIAAASLVVGVVLALTYQNYLKKKASKDKEIPSKIKEPDTQSREIILEAKNKLKNPRYSIN